VRLTVVATYPDAETLQAMLESGMEDGVAEHLRTASGHIDLDPEDLDLPADGRIEDGDGLGLIFDVPSPETTCYMGEHVHMEWQGFRAGHLVGLATIDSRAGA